MLGVNGKKIVVLSANCQGLHTPSKRLDVLPYLKDKNPDIVCLQDTHWTDYDQPEIRKQWGGECIVHGKNTNSLGVAILFGQRFEFKINSTYKDELGNMLIVDLLVSDLPIKLFNIYGPNKDSPVFYEQLANLVNLAVGESHVLLCGDLNITLDPKLDMYNCRHINNQNSRNVVLKMIKDCNLVDVFRQLNPNKTIFTLRRRLPSKQARLDYFIGSSTLIDLVGNCENLPGYRTDHSLIRLDLFINTFKQGKGLWKFNTILLKNQDYIQMINKAINVEAMKYIIPVCDPSYLRLNCLRNLELTIDDNLFLEAILLRLRGDTIKFASNLKHSRDYREDHFIESMT